MLVALVCGATVPAYAQQAPPPPAGADALASARQAWDAKQWDAAENFYKLALDRGGLAPSDTIDAYVHLGSARAILKRTALSRAAFRQAAAIDVHFHVPSDAGKRAATQATLAKRDEARVGSISLRAKFPTQVLPANQPFNVDATLDGKHNAIVARVGVDARDPETGKHYAHADVVARSSHFEVPGEYATPGATLLVRIDALDAHDNRLATREARVRIEAPPPPPTPPPAPAPVASTPAPAPTTVPGPIAATKPTPEPIPDRDKGKSGGFWSSPWPYVIGTVALAGAGAAVYLTVRPTDDVSVGSARVTAR